MNIQSLVSRYQVLRAQPMWRLLVSDNGASTIALLQSHFMGDERHVVASILYERVERDLEALRAAGHELPRTAQAYVATWLSEGYLIRRFPEGAREELYELSAGAAEAIRYVMGLAQPRSTATESRLTVVIDQLVRLAEETETDPEARVAVLLAERERIDREIALVEGGRYQALSEERAIERVREIIGLAEDLTGDFRRVRDEFDTLNRDLRERIMDHDGSRGDVLGDLFAGVDVIAESDAGRTFYAFWRLLTNPAQNANLDGALEQVVTREFMSELGFAERHFLRRLTRTLLDEGGMVHEVLQQFARSLKQFVQSREYQEQRRLSQVLRGAQKAAMEIKNDVKINQSLPYDLQLTTSAISSLDQWALFDPAAHSVDGRMAQGVGGLVDLEQIAALVAESEIDFRRLRLNICDVLSTADQASIGDVMAIHPVHQGLGSVVGYMVLGSRHGQRGAASEVVTWEIEGGALRRARIPVIHFLKESVDAIA